MSENNWMWGIKIEETDRVVTSGIVNWPAHMCTFAYGYVFVGATKSINSKLYATIPATDVRKGWFLNEKGQSPQPLCRTAEVCYRQKERALHQREVRLL